MHAESEEEILQELTRAVQRLPLARDAMDREVNTVNTLTALLNTRGKTTGTVTPPQYSDDDEDNQIVTASHTQEYLLGSHLRVGDRVRITNPNRDQPRNATVVGAEKTFIQLRAKGYPELIKRTPRKLIKLN